MSTFAKVMVVVNFILAIAFLAAAGTLHGAAESWKGKHDALNTAKTNEISALEGQLKSKQNQVDQLLGETRSLEARAQAAEVVQKHQADSNAVLKGELDTKNAEISKLQSNLTDATNAVKEQTARNEQLMNQLAGETAAHKQTQEKLATAEEFGARETQRADNAEKSLASAEATNKSLTDRLDSAMTQIKVYETTRGALSVAAVTAAVKGVVQAASASDDVYIVSVGSNEKVKVGYEFTVSRGDKYVSTIVIDSVFPNHAAGHTKPGFKKADIQPGDAVATATGL